MPTETSSPLRLLYVSSELFPFVKTGGLADVSYSLPKALAARGLDVTILLPAYPQALERVSNKNVVYEFTGAETAAVKRGYRLLATSLPDSTARLLLLDAPDLFRREGGIYVDANQHDWPDNAQRYAQFCRAACAIALDACNLRWRPDVVHGNDWQSGLIAGLLRHCAPSGSRRPKSVFTIHNLAYQGNFSRDCFDSLQLPQSWWSPEYAEFYGNFSFLKAGLVFADYLTTVSPTYRQEILTAEFGNGMEGVLRTRQEKLIGIINGVDYATWNPAIDPYLTRNYDHDSLEDKIANKLALQRQCRLPEQTAIPLVGLVGRLAAQKGIDLVIEVIRNLATESVQWVVLGSGDAGFEQQLQRLSRQFPDRVFFRPGFDEVLAHRIEAGADLFLMPSRYEPCGLNQLYSLRYGTLPIVRRTGGLADTVVQANARTLESDTATGFVFEVADATELQRTVLHALTLFKDKPLWLQLCRRAMQQNFSWQESARQYHALYRRLLLTQQSAVSVPAYPA